jgi:hypothetical protein
MGAWLEAYEKLPTEAQDRVQRWLHLNHFIARTLRIDWQKWVDDYLTPTFQAPLDYSFMRDCLPDFVGGLGMEGQGASYSAAVDPATAQVSRVPLRAKNNLGRLSPELQDRMALLLEKDGEPMTLTPADVAQLQKILPGEKPLAKLDRKDFRKVSVCRDGDEIVIAAGDKELVRQPVLELGAIMKKALV